MRAVHARAQNRHFAEFVFGDPAQGKRLEGGHQRQDVELAAVVGHEDVRTAGFQPVEAAHAHRDPARPQVAFRPTADQAVGPFRVRVQERHEINGETPEHGMQDDEAHAHRGKNHHNLPLFPPINVAAL